MGVRAFTDRYAHNLIADWAANPGSLWAILPAECSALVAEFREAGEAGEPQD